MNLVCIRRINYVKVNCGINRRTTWYLVQINQTSRHKQKIGAAK